MNNIADDISHAYQDGYNAGYNDGYQAGKREPVRHGRWMECKPYNPEFNGYEWSECGAKYQGFSPDNYCANCGCRMDLGDKNEPDDGTV